MSDMTELFRSWCQKNWRWRLAAVMSPLLFIRWGPGKIVGEIAATQLVCVVLSRKKDPAKKRYAMVVVVAWLCHWESALVVLCAKPKKNSSCCCLLPCSSVLLWCLLHYSCLAACHIVGKVSSLEEHYFDRQGSRFPRTWLLCCEDQF